MISNSATALAFVAVIGVLAAVFTTVADAQTSFGTITGAITRPTAAVVPKATVSITNVRTNGVRTLTTDDSGSYNVPPASTIPP